LLIFNYLTLSQLYPDIFDSNDSKDEISIVKKSCIDKDAKEVDCEVSIGDR